MVMPGVNVGKNAVVGAMSVVTKDVPKNQIVAGNPARQIGERSLIKNENIQ
jgi:maltose O-acetyltransferase